MTTADRHTDTPARRGRLTPAARANLATIVVESDRKAGKKTPQWIRDLAPNDRRTA